MLKEKFNGNRLKTARIYCGKTLEELANDIGVTKQAISQYENSETTPETSKMFKIVSTLFFPWEYYYQEDTNVIETKATYFRSLLSTHKKDRNAQIKKGEYLALLYDYLSDNIRFPKYNIPNIVVDKLDEAVDFDNISLEVRKHWNLGEEPIKDMVYQLEKSGIIITSLKPTSSAIDAYSQKLKTKCGDKHLIVLTESKETRVRRQFSCAHELGHIILHNWNEDWETISKSDFTKIENQANSFASAFLLPKNSFAADVSKHPSSLEYYCSLKLKWNVSMSAMMIRAKNLGLINSNDYQNLMRKMAYRKWRTREPYDDLKPSCPVVLKSAVKKILKGKKWTGDDFIKNFSEKYNIELSKKIVEDLLNLETNMLNTSEERRVLNLDLK